MRWFPWPQQFVAKVTVPEVAAAMLSVVLPCPWMSIPEWKPLPRGPNGELISVLNGQLRPKLETGPVTTGPVSTGGGSTTGGLTTATGGSATTGAGGTPPGTKISSPSKTWSGVVIPLPSQAKMSSRATL